MCPPGHDMGGGAQHTPPVAVVVPCGRRRGVLIDRGNGIGDGVLVPLKKPVTAAAVGVAVVIAVAVLVVVVAAGVVVGVVVILLQGRVLHPHRVVQAELRVIRRLPPVPSSAAKQYKVVQSPGIQKRAGS